MFDFATPFEFQVFKDKSHDINFVLADLNALGLPGFEYAAEERGREAETHGPKESPASGAAWHGLFFQIVS